MNPVRVTIYVFMTVLLLATLAFCIVGVIGCVMSSMWRGVFNAILIGATATLTLHRIGYLYEARS